MKCHVTVGTDCSGIDAPIEALTQLKILFKHKWSCENDKFARMSIEANYNPEIMYEDISNRNHKLLPSVDIYVCGFPCQPFSFLGDYLGLHDKRSKIMDHCIQVIRLKKPKLFVLENVKGRTKTSVSAMTYWMISK
jgi:DNA (cytosine-5)-methyltransferase 1